MGLFDFGSGPSTKSQAIYSFEIWDETLSKAAPETELANPKAQSAKLMYAPQSINIERSFRSDFGLDLAGNPVVAEAGFGPGKWSLRGAWGVGTQGLSPSAMEDDDDQGKVTPGLKARLDLERLFQNYADTNKNRQAKGQPLFKLVFKGMAGGPSEFKSEVWWILPMGMPTVERSVSKPLDASYSISFWALAQAKKQASVPDKIAGLTIASLVATFQSINQTIGKTLKSLSLANNALFQSVNGTMQGIQGLINNARTLVNVAGTNGTLIANLLNQAAFQIRSADRVVHDSTTLPKQVKQDLRDAYKNLRAAVGASLIELKTNAGISSQDTVAPKRPTPVIPGRDLRQIASAVLGDANLWPDIASMNNLVYPFVAWPIGGSTASSSGLIPGTVASPGSTLSVASLASQGSVVDPVGTDLSPVNGRDLASGVANIVNALQRRLNTPRGYLPHHPSYGSSFPSMIGSPLTIDTALAIREEVSRVLLSDPRVTQVTQVSVNADPSRGVISATATVQTILGPAQFGSAPAFIAGP